MQHRRHFNCPTTWTQSHNPPWSIHSNSATCTRPTSYWPWCTGSYCRWDPWTPIHSIKPKPWSGSGDWCIHSWFTNGHKQPCFLAGTSGSLSFDDGLWCESHRKISFATPYCLRWRWTTFQSKAQQFLVNGSSHLLKKLWVTAETGFFMVWWNNCRCLNFHSQRGDHLILQPELQRKTFFHTLNNHWVVQSSFQRTYVHLCEISLATSPQKPTLIDRGVIIT